MNNAGKKLRLNITVDPAVFPEIHAELSRISNNKKRIGGKRLLSLASLGLFFTTQINSSPISSSYSNDS